MKFDVRACTASSGAHGGTASFGAHACASSGVRRFAVQRWRDVFTAGQQQAVDRVEHLAGRHREIDNAHFAPDMKVAATK